MNNNHCRPISSCMGCHFILGVAVFWVPPSPQVVHQSITGSTVGFSCCLDCLIVVADFIHFVCLYFAFFMTLVYVSIKAVNRCWKRRQRPSHTVICWHSDHRLNLWLRWITSVLVSCILTTEYEYGYIRFENLNRTGIRIYLVQK